MGLTLKRNFWREQGIKDIIFIQYTTGDFPNMSGGIFKKKQKTNPIPPKRNKCPNEMPNIYIRNVDSKKKTMHRKK